MRHKHADILIALAEGKDVQFLDNDKGCWTTYIPAKHGSPLLPASLDWQWQVKPPAKEDYFFYFGYDGHKNKPEVRPHAGTLFNSPNNVATNWQFKGTIKINGETNEPMWVRRDE